MPRTVVLVLGDIGRSPRMQYHAMSLADMKRSHVELVGYPGSDPRPEVVKNNRISIHHLMQFPSPLPRSLFVVWAPIKVVLQVLQLSILLLFWLPAFDSILVQNPPGLPALLVARLCSWARGAQLVIDWHNFGYTLLSYRFGGREEHPFVVASKWYEKILGRLSDNNICVTRAMAAFLEKEWGIRSRVMHDQPPAHFGRLDAEQHHRFMMEQEKEGGCFSGVGEWAREVDKKRSGGTGSRSRRWRDDAKLLEDVPGDAISSFTYAIQYEDEEEPDYGLRSTRPAIVVSSTSWTPDEDFGILLEAAKSVDKAAAQDPNIPPIVIIITGKGAMKEEFEAKVKRAGLVFVKIITAWLKSEDYPKVLGVADLGVSLHTSSSGLDLPMKVVDMFGCELPVLAHDFKCLGELVDEGKNGFRFDKPAVLAERIVQLLRNFPNGDRTLKRMRHEIRKARVGWNETWDTAARRMFQIEREPRAWGRMGWATAILLLAVAAGVLMALWKYSE